MLFKPVVLQKLVNRLNQLETKVRVQSLEINQLRVKVDWQETRLNEANRKFEIILQEARNASNCDDAIFTKRKKRNADEKRKTKPRVIDNILTEQAKKASSNSQSVKIEFRSCHEIFLAYEGGVFSSLAHNRDVFNAFIDPDGQGIGDPPIFVECDMANNGIYPKLYTKHFKLICVWPSGTTKVVALTEKLDGYEYVLDSASDIIVQNCTEPGCSVHEINYGHATMRQLIALSTISGQCRQFIRVSIF